MSKQRKVPLRKCLVTKELKEKEELVRLVKTKEGEVLIDQSGKKNGRGAYLTLDREIILQAKEKNVLAQAFKMQIDLTVYDDLLVLLGDNK